jgi:hypothetical protein
MEAGAEALLTAAVSGKAEGGLGLADVLVRSKVGEQ